MRQQLMPTNDFLTPPGSDVATNIHGDPSLRSDVVLDLNALSTPGNNPWATLVGIPGLLEPDPTTIPVTQSRFSRVGDIEISQQLNGDGNGFMDSYLSTLANDPNIEIVTWGNGPVPSVPPTPPEGCLAASAVPGWTDETNYPFYHVVFFYNPDVRKFIVATLTGQTPPAEAVITRRELVELLMFLDGRW